MATKNSIQQSLFFSDTPKKKCKGPCGSFKSLEDFGFVKAQGTRQSRRRGYCKDCRKQFEKERREQDSGQTKYVQKRAWMKKTYKISLEEFEKKIDAQGGVCAICKKPETRVLHGIQTKLSIDHDHTTGKIRDLLCNLCNGILGRAKDDPEILRRAADYLEEHRREEKV